MTTDIRKQLTEIKQRLSSLKAQTSSVEDGGSASPSASASAPILPAEKRATDSEIREALARFGWKLAPGSGKPRRNPADEWRKAKAEAALRAEAETTAAAAATAILPKLPESEPAEESIRNLFGSLNQDILKEVFEPEELEALQGGETHIYKGKDMESVASQAKKAEAPADESRKTRLLRRHPAEKALAENAAEAPRIVYSDRDFRPIRRKREYRTGLRGGLMYFGFVICVSVALASIAWLAADDVLSLNKEELEAEVYVGETVRLDAVATELHSKGLVKYKELFCLFGKLTHAEEKIEPGTYTLSSKLDFNAMIHAMQHNEAVFTERETVTVTIPEGKTLKQTFQILADHGVCSYETLVECASNHDFKYTFLFDLPLGDENRLEGYLFPDTYQFYASSSPEEAIDKFLANFNSKLSDEMVETAEQMGYSLHEIVTVASLIEMEAGNDTERNTIASVIYNRLNSSYYPYLQIDATIQYALEERVEYLTDAELAVDSPYNTYKYTGLPPGPIANPGLASLRAALAPENTGYYFYALNKSGVHNFFSNLSDFERFTNSSDFGG